MKPRQYAGCIEAPYDCVIAAVGTNAPVALDVGVDGVIAGVDSVAQLTRVSTNDPWSDSTLRLVAKYDAATLQGLSNNETKDSLVWTLNGRCDMSGGAVQH